MKVSEKHANLVILGFLLSVIGGQMKKLIAAVGVHLVVAPLVPLYAVHLLGEFIDENATKWKWTNYLADLAEHVEAWGNR